MKVGWINEGPAIEAGSRIVLEVDPGSNTARLVEVNTPAQLAKEKADELWRRFVDVLHDAIYGTAEHRPRIPDTVLMALQSMLRDNGIVLMDYLERETLLERIRDLEEHL